MPDGPQFPRGHQRDCSDATRRSIGLSGLGHVVDPLKSRMLARSAKNLRLAASTSKRYVIVEFQEIEER